MPYKVSDVKPYINLCIYAEPGIGKTTFAVSGEKHPKMQHTLVLNVEGGLLSVAGVEGVEVEDVRSVDELEEYFWKIVNKEDGYGHFQTVVIDSATEVQTLDLEHAAREGWERDQKKKEKDRKRKSVDNLWQEDYGENTTKLKRVFRWFRDAPFNTIYTALIKREFEKLPKGSDRTPELLSVRPAFTEKLGISVEGYCDFVWYMYLDDVAVGEAEEGEEPTTEKKRFILTQPEGVYRAKTRGARFAEALGKVVENPDLAEIYDLLLKSEIGGGEFSNESDAAVKPKKKKKKESS